MFVFYPLDIQFIEKNGLPSYDDPKGRFGYSYKEKDSYGYLKTSIIGGGGKRNYKIYININHSRYLSIYKIYYPNGIIKEKCLQNDFGFFIGKFYKYNEAGRLIETIDMDKGFDFTFEQLKGKLIKEDGISLEHLSPVDDGGGGVKYSIGISRFSEPASRWYVRYSDPDNSADGARGTNVEIIYDGKTGEKISKSFIPVM